MKLSKFFDYFSIFIVIVLLIAQIAHKFYTFGQWVKYTMFISSCILFIVNMINVFVLEKNNIKSKLWTIGPTLLFVVYWFFICF